MSSDAHELARQSAKGYRLLQCEECAHNIRSVLVAAGHKGQVIEIRGKQRLFFIVCLSYDGGITSITQNGRHVGVRVGDMVFDNLHPDGLPFESWLADFDAVGGVEIVSTTEF